MKASFECLNSKPVLPVAPTREVAEHHIASFCLSCPAQRVEAGMNTFNAWRIMNISVYNNTGTSDAKYSSATYESPHGKILTVLATQLRAFLGASNASRVAPHIHTTMSLYCCSGCQLL